MYYFLMEIELLDNEEELTALLNKKVEFIKDKFE